MSARRSREAPAPVADLLDRWQGAIGATRWVVAWRDEQWRLMGPAVGHDSLYLELAMTWPDDHDLVDPAGLGDKGVRLRAAGVERLSSWVLDPDAPVIAFFENPTSKSARPVERARWLVPYLEVAQTTAPLLDLHRWFADISPIARGALPLSQALPRLAAAIGASGVAVAAPATRGVTLTAWSERARGRVVDEVLFQHRWADVVDDVSSLAGPVATQLRESFDVSDTTAVLADGSSAALLVRGATVPAADLQLVVDLLGYALRSASDLLGARERARLEERTRLATVLHEELSQRLTAITLRVDLLSSRTRDGARSNGLAEVRSDVVDALEALRSAIYELTPPEPTWVHLDSGLRRFVEDHARQRHLDVEFSVDGAPRPVSPEHVSLVFAAVQEALTNVAKHSGVSTANVVLRYASDTVEVTIQDRGVGVREDAGEQAGWGHQGLGVLRTRSRLAGARLDVRGSDGDGTTVVLRVPTQDVAVRSESPDEGERDL